MRAWRGQRLAMTGARTSSPAMPFLVRPSLARTLLALPSAARAARLLVVAMVLSLIAQSFGQVFHECTAHHAGACPAAHEGSSHESHSHHSHPLNSRGHPNRTDTHTCPTCAMLAWVSCQVGGVDAAPTLVIMTAAIGAVEQSSSRSTEDASPLGVRARGPPIA